ncbi:hypothetical protein LMH87_000409 [Akanthomyces muscarius]|uniref:Uncharacterized protein n=1 Tax=Akanthomyces muscarius TaxID=2231603 RepID=A0A9W8UMJ6_AKAMU|nr:hypothetical protein LMH87_000409 [Akanthomyces muscarius]KAJ4155152.1 hypothetical protein LMH87_000409 [Akanthomyces muscarius]
MVRLFTCSGLVRPWFGMPTSNGAAQTAELPASRTDLRLGCDGAPHAQPHVSLSSVTRDDEGRSSRIRS